MKRRWLTVGVLALSLALAAGCGAGRNQGTAGGGAQAVQEQGASAVGAGGGGAAPAAAEVKGDRYKVVPEESTASYSVQEKFLERNLDAVAVGRTSAISGELVLNGGLLQASTVTVDLKTLKSDQSRRDQRLKTTGLETDKYPTAEFTITEVAGEAAALAAGQEVSFKLTGQMKLHGVAKPWTWDAKAKMEGEILRLTATTTFNMNEFGIEPPNVLNLISVNDQVQLDVSITAKKG